MIKEITILTTGGKRVCIEQTTDGVSFYTVFSDALTPVDMVEVNDAIEMVKKHNTGEKI